MKVPIIGKASAALLAIASLASGEELVAFSSSHEGPAAWQVDGLSLQVTNGQLRFTLERDGVGHATVRPHLPALPQGLVRLLAREGGMVRVTGDGVVTNLAPAGWDVPADLALPSGTSVWRLSVEIAGRAGATWDVRELLATGRLDLEEPLLQASGRQPAAWRVVDGVDFAAAGLRVRGAVETRADMAFTNRAVLAVRVGEVVGPGVDVLAVPSGPDGVPGDPIRLGGLTEPGLHVFPFDRVAWPVGVARVGVRIQATSGSAWVREVVVGRWPDA